MSNADEIEAIKKRIEMSVDGEIFMSLGQDVEDDINYRPQIRKVRKRKAEMFEWLRHRKN